MNHVAHFWLAGPDPQLIAGALLADHLRGALDPTMAPALADGVRLHRAIDAWVDRDADFRAARTALPPAHRRTGGIALDVAFDHWLVPRFEAVTGEEFSSFVRRVGAALDAVHEGPPAFVAIARRIAAAPEQLERYAEPEFVDAVYARLAARLSRPTPLADARRAVAHAAARIEPCFARAAPRLAAFAASVRAAAGRP